MAGPESRSKIATGDHCLTALQQNFQDTIHVFLCFGTALLY
jgi:hypothetical protein